MSKDVVVLGKGTLAARVAGWFHRSDDYALAAVVPVIPEPTWTDSVSEWARSNGVRLIPSGHYRDLGDCAPDLAVSVFYDKIITADFIDRCARILNIHNGPLPRYRGVNPVNWALKNGERKHGVTIHEITPGIDDGPVVAQVEYSIYPELDEVIDVYTRSLEYAWTLFEQTMPILDAIEAVAQDESRATYYSAADAERLGDRRDFTRGHRDAAA